MDSFDRAARRELDRPMAGWRIHFTIYVVIQVMLIAIWWLTGADLSMPWFIFPMLGWGSGVIAHYMAVRSARRGVA